MQSQKKWPVSKQNEVNNISLVLQKLETYHKVPVFNTSLKWSYH